MLKYIQAAMVIQALEGDLTMSLNMTIGIVAGALALVEFYVYILAIYGRDWRLRRIKNPTRPNRTTWFIWGALGLVAASSYEASGATTTVWFAWAYALGFCTVAILSIWKGEFYPHQSGWRKILSVGDGICILGAIGAGVLWKLVGPEAALAATIVIDLLGAWPTARKALLRPRTESRLAWTITTFSTALNLFAINWGAATIAIVAYPLYMLVVNGVITVVLYRWPRKTLVRLLNTRRT